MHNSQHEQLQSTLIVSSNNIDEVPEFGLRREGDSVYYIWLQLNKANTMFLSVFSLYREKKFIMAYLLNFLMVFFLPPL